MPGSPLAAHRANHNTNQQFFDFAPIHSLLLCLRTVSKESAFFFKYNKPSVHVDFDPKDDLDSMLTVKDPAVTLVRCNGNIFLAVIRLLDLRVNSTNIERLPIRLLHEPNVRARGQIMCIALIDQPRQHEADQRDGVFRLAETPSWRSTSASAYRSEASVARQTLWPPLQNFCLVGLTSIYVFSE